MTVPPKPKKNIAEVLVAGGTAGMVARTVIAPIERAKILYQIQRGVGQEAGWTGILPKILREEGALAMWKGNSAAVMRVVPYMSIQFLGFEEYRTLLGRFALQPDLHNMTAGSLAGLTAVALTYPLDTVRARMAAQMAGVADARYSGMLDCLVRLPRERGVASLYKGMSTTMIGVAPYAGLKFASYEAMKRSLAPLMGVDSEADLPASARVTCGMVAGGVAQTFVYPFDVIRRRFQTSDKPPYKGTWDALTTIAREEGVARGLFRGLSLNYLKTIPNVAVYMSLYDIIKHRLVPKVGNEQ
jgi:hypothetical protein